MAVFFVCAITSPARAAIIWNAGVLHAQSSANSPGGGLQQHLPPDVVMNTNTASHSTTASSPTMAFATASTNVTIGPSISIQASSDFSFLSGQSSASASVSGTATFTETGTEVLTPFFSASANRGSGGVTIKDASNTTIASYLSSSPPVGDPAQVMLTPGVYTVSWNWGTQPFVGTGGGSSMNFSLALVPEPASLALLALPALTLRRRRRFQ